MKNNEPELIRLLSSNQACHYLGMGRTRGVELLKQIGAEIRFGGKYLYDKNVIDAFVDSQLKEKQL